MSWPYEFSKKVPQPGTGRDDYVTVYKEISNTTKLCDHYLFASKTE